MQKKIIKNHWNQAKQLEELHKTHKCIASCNTLTQLQNSRKMLNRYLEYNYLTQTSMEIFYDIQKFCILKRIAILIQMNRENKN